MNELIQQIEKVISDLENATDHLPENASNTAYSLGYAVAQLENARDSIKKSQQWSNQNHGC